MGPEILLDDGQGHGLPQIAAVGNRIYVAWETSDTGENPRILFRRSQDRGASFGPLLQLSTHRSEDFESRPVGLAASGGRVYTAWTHFEFQPFGNSSVYARRSTDGGQTFEDPVALIENVPSSDWWVNDNRLAADGRHVAVVWGAHDRSYSFPEVSRIFLARSETAGRDFHAPLVISESTITEAEHPEVAVSRRRTHVIWRETTRGSSPGVALIGRTIDPQGNLGPVVHIDADTPGSLSEWWLTAEGDDVDILWSEAVRGEPTRLWYRHGRREIR